MEFEVGLIIPSCSVIHGLFEADEGFRNLARQDDRGCPGENCVTVIPRAREPQKAFRTLPQLGAGKLPQHSARDVRSRKSLVWGACWEIAAGARPALPVWGWHGVPGQFGSGPRRQLYLLPVGTTE